MRKLSIAIDGPAGAGKSSVAKRLAHQLGYLYIDTGAMYRAVTWAALQKNCVQDKASIIELLTTLDLEMEATNNAFTISVWHKDITGLIRTPEVNSNVSSIAAIKEVRTYLVAQQRKLASRGGVILDGRDIGSVVLPNADIKFYLTASVKARAYRRWLEVQGTSNQLSLSEIEQSVSQRDHLDMTRKESPLICVKEAIVIDSSELSFEGTVQTMMHIIEEKL